MVDVLGDSAGVLLPTKIRNRLELVACEVRGALRLSAALIDERYAGRYAVEITSSKIGQGVLFWDEELAEPRSTESLAGYLNQVAVEFGAGPEPVAVRAVPVGGLPGDSRRLAGLVRRSGERHRRRSRERAELARGDLGPRASRQPERPASLHRDPGQREDGPLQDRRRPLSHEPARPGPKAPLRGSRDRG